MTDSIGKVVADLREASRNLNMPGSFAMSEILKHYADRLTALSGCERDGELIEALRIVNKLNNLGDCVYQVRERVIELNDGFTGSSWGHPNVIAYGKAVEVINKAIAKGDSSG